MTRTLNGWHATVQNALGAIARAPDRDQAISTELRRSYTAAVRALARAASTRMRQPAEDILRRHRAQLHPWAQ